MKVTFQKDFLDHKKGDTIEVEEGRANYWERVGVIKPRKEKKEVEPATEKAVVSEAKEKKAAQDITTEKKTAVKATAKKKH